MGKANAAAKFAAEFTAISRIFAMAMAKVNNKFPTWIMTNNKVKDMFEVQMFDNNNFSD